MAVTLLYRVTKVKLGSLELDAAVSEQHQSSVKVTDHPVEGGATMTDHAQVQPMVLTIDGFVSNTPIKDVAHGFLPFATLLTAASEGDAGGGRAESAFEELNKIRDACEPITVVTKLKTYENMMMTGLNIPRDARTGDALRFTATFKEIRFVAPSYGRLQKEEAQAKPPPNAKQDDGAQPSTPTAAPEDKRSWLKAGVDTGKAVVKSLLGG